MFIQMAIVGFGSSRGLTTSTLPVEDLGMLPLLAKWRP
jgi:hypothetical protein